jgi:hypothetical protein
VPSHARRRAVSPLLRSALAAATVTAVLGSLAGCQPAAEPSSAEQDAAAMGATSSSSIGDAARVPAAPPVPPSTEAAPPVAETPPAETPAPVEEEQAAAERPAPAAKPPATSAAKPPAPPVAKPSAAPAAPVGGSRPIDVPANGWLSGASGTGAASGAFGTWRGRPLEIAGHWSDNNQDMVHHWGLTAGFEWANYVGPMDVAIGAIGPGESWAQAANGAYDDRWRQSLTNLRKIRGDRGQMFIRFAHESNGNWYPWAVDAGEVQAFKAAWARFRGLQQQLYPEARLVFNVNRESIGSGVDWRQTFPGPGMVDVYSVDYYNQWPAVASAQEWAASMDDVDQYGAPKGLEAHRAFAESQGLPLAVSEWSANADFNDSPAYIEGMYQFFRTHAGSGPGDLLYEILFNVDGYDKKFYLFGDGLRLPQSAGAYQRLW